MERASGTNEAVRAGAMYRPAVDAHHEYWRFITAGFVHFSFLHLFMNMYALYAMGRSMEMMLGHLNYAILLLGSIVTGNFFMYQMNRPGTVSGGLSTGLYGLMLAEIVLIVRISGWQAIFSSSMLYPMLVNLAMNFMPGIGWAGHLGGACFGILYMMIRMAV